MHYGSSEEEARSEEEAGAQDRGGEEADGEEDRYRTAEEGYEEKVAGEARGRWLPRLPLSPVRPGACRGAFPQAFSISFTLAARPLRAARCHRRARVVSRLCPQLFIAAGGAETLLGDQRPKLAEG